LLRLVFLRAGVHCRTGSLERPATRLLTRTFIPNSYAIYYAVGENQPIGAIALDKFTTET